MRRRSKRRLATVQSLECRCLLSSTGMPLQTANSFKFNDQAILSDILTFESDSGRVRFGKNDGTGFNFTTVANWNADEGWIIFSGDFNGDGLQDLAGFRTRGDNAGRWQLGISNGSTFQTLSSIRWNPDAGWRDFLVGDFNGDGNADIAARNASGQWWAAQSTGTGFQSNYLVRWSADGWTGTVSGDFNHDGKDDIAGLHHNGQWWIGISTGIRLVSTYAGKWDSVDESGWRNIQTGDFNGDSRADVVAQTYDGKWYFGNSTGAPTGGLGGQRFERYYAGRWTTTHQFDEPFQQVLIGDFDGDGLDDLAGRDAASQWWTLRSLGTSAVTEYKGRWDDEPWAMVVGDYNGDGRDDIAGYDVVSGQWLVTASTESRFQQIHYGDLPAFTEISFLSSNEYSSTVTAWQTLSSSERIAVEHALEIIRGTQLSDGAFNMVDHGKAANDPVWIAPYFANHAALALLSAHEIRPNMDDLTRVGAWLEWLAAHQEAGGFWFDYTGTVAAYDHDSFVDAHDSSAAMFLLVVERYRRSGGLITPGMRDAARRSLQCLQNLRDQDGLTWAKPDYKVKFLLDNIEVWGGLRAAKVFFESTGDLSESAIASQHLAAIIPRLQTYWEAVEPGRFAWALHENGVFEGGLTSLYPHGLAQLFGVAFVRPDETAFIEVVGTFTPQTSVEAAAGAERFLMAAARLGKEYEYSWRETVVQDTNNFSASSTYIHRPGLAILGLLEGTHWL